MSKQFLKIRSGTSYPGLAADPADPANGDLYYNTTSNLFRQYLGGSWSNVGTSAGSGTVTSVSVTGGNGLAGTVATPTTTPAITLSTTLTTPVLAGNGTALIAATTTGTGSTVALSGSPTLATPTFTTNATTPLLIGGTTPSSTLTLESTSGAGTSDGILFKTGSQVTAMTITTNQFVGINTTSPVVPLQVAGTAYFTTPTYTGGSAGSFLQISQGATSGNTTLTLQGFTGGGTSANGNITLNALGGFVGIETGTTTPANALQIGDGTTTNPTLYFNGVNATSGGSIISFNQNGVNNSLIGDFNTIVGGTNVKDFLLYGRAQLRFWTNNTQAMLIDTSQNVTLSSLAGATSSRAVLASTTGLLSAPVSDQRLKVGVRDLSDVLDPLSTIRSLRPVCFYWDPDHPRVADFGARQEIGLLAQEVAEIVPQVVSREKDGYYSVAYEKLVPLLLESIKALENRIQVLEAK